MKLLTKLCVAVSAMFAPVAAMATPSIDLSGIEAAVDPAVVVASLVVIAGLVATVLWGRKAIRFALSLIGR